MRRFNEHMLFNSNNGGGGGPWGGGGGGKGPWGGGGGGPQGPDLDVLLRKGRDQLKVVLGGRGGGRGGGKRGGGGPGMERYLPYAIPIVLVGAWLMQSFYSVKPEEKSIELFLGEFSQVGEPGLNFAFWPLVSYEILSVTRENTIDIGTAKATTGRIRTAEQGLMLTGDENIVDIDFQVVWNIARPDLYLFNLAEPNQTIQAVSESAMRAVIARSKLAPILNRDRAAISQEVQETIQATLDSYDSGVNIVRVNFDGADPPPQVIDGPVAADPEQVLLEAEARVEVADTAHRPEKSLLDDIFARLVVARSSLRIREETPAEVLLDRQPLLVLTCLQTVDIRGPVTHRDSSAGGANRPGYRFPWPNSQLRAGR